jgi:hypothetical protein
MSHQGVIRRLDLLGYGIRVDRIVRSTAYPTLEDSDESTHRGFGE